jgi:hypothetical protein
MKGLPLDHILTSSVHFSSLTFTVYFCGWPLQVCLSITYSLFSCFPAWIFVHIYHLSHAVHPHVTHLISLNYFFCPPPRGSVPQHTRFLGHAWRRTTVGKTRLDERSAHCTELYLDYTQRSQQTNIHAPSRIQTHILSRQAMPYTVWPLGLV